MMETGFNDRIGRPPSMSRGRATPVAAFRKTSTYLDGTRRENAFSGVLLFGREIRNLLAPTFFFFRLYLRLLFIIHFLDTKTLSNKPREEDYYCFRVKLLRREGASSLFPMFRSA